MTMISCLNRLAKIATVAALTLAAVAFLAEPAQKASADVSPDQLVSGGSSADGTTLYLCAAIYQNGVHPGYSLDGQCHIGYGGNEILINSPDYISITNPNGYNFNWVSTSNEQPLPQNTLATGFENGKSLYVCRSQYAGGLYPGKVIPDGYCNIPYNGQEINTTQYDVLTADY